MSDREAPGQFERLLFQAVMHTEPGPGALLEQAAEGLALVRFPRSRSRGLVVRYVPGREREQTEHLRQLMGQLARQSLEVALVGGPEAARTILTDARPRGPLARVMLYHLGDRGEPWRERAGRGAQPLWSALDSLARAPVPSEDDWQQFRHKVEQDAAVLREEASEAAAFTHVTSRHAPRATWTLAAIMLVVFALEYLWGGVESAPTLVRMGALVPEKVRAGEWWRLISCTFLHAGVLHLAFNTYVLLMLGNSLERILGTRRFLVLYGASALGGSLASLFFLDAGFSVGASGALWGLLAAEAVLAYRPRGLLPRAMAENAKRVAMINLFLNVLNSFRPQVDMAAHFGGGIVGGLLLLGSVLTAGLPRLGQDEAAAPARTSRAPRWLWPAAAGVVAILAVGLAMGLGKGRAWALDAAPELVSRPMPALGLEASIPAQLEPRPAEAQPASPDDDAATAIVFGDMLADPAAIEILRLPLDEPIPAEAMDSELAALEQQLGKPEGELTLRGAVERVVLGEHPAVIATYQLPNELIIERGVQVQREALVRVDVYRWPGLGAAYQGLVKTILGSLRPLQP